MLKLWSASYNLFSNDSGSFLNKFNNVLNSFCRSNWKLFNRNGIEVMTNVIDESRGDGHTHNLGGTIKRIFLSKNSIENK